MTLVKDSRHDAGVCLCVPAGIAFKGSIFGADEAQTTLDCNFFGTMRVCEQLKHLIPAGGRIVNVSSRCVCIKYDFSILL